MPKKPAAIPPAPPAPAKTREQLMDERAAADFAAMDRINNDRSIEHRIMTEPGARFEPQPSNVASQGVRLDDMTFSQVGETQYGGSNFMKARRE